MAAKTFTLCNVSFRWLCMKYFNWIKTLHGSMEKKKKKMPQTEGWTGVELVYSTLNKACKIISLHKKDWL